MNKARQTETAKSTAKSVRPTFAGTESPALAPVRETYRKIFEDGRPEEAGEFVLSALDAVLRKSRDLELLVAKLRRERVGKSSEKVPPEQLKLLLEALSEQDGEIDLEGGMEADAKLDEEIERAKDSTAEPKRRKRAVQTRDVRKERHDHLVPAEERQCAQCGQDRKAMGWDTTRRLEYVPGHFVEHVHRLEKLGCECKDEVVTAQAPPTLFARSAATASLLAHIIVSKFVHHCPLHRLHNVYALGGATIPVSTMAEWVARSADLLAPLRDLLLARILAAYVVATDATGLKVLDRDSSQNIERGTMWCTVGDDRDVVFHYRKTGEGEAGPWDILKDRTGYIRADAANVFDRLFNGEAASAVELGCLAHARRKFEQLKDNDPRAAYPLRLIRRIYRLETLADAKGLSPTARAAQRKLRTLPELEKLKRFLLKTLQHESPDMAFAKACAYSINHWEALTRFVADGRLTLDNNVCENQMRAIAVGRKNYLFAGSHEAAERTAVLYSLTRTCAQHGVPPWQYLSDVLAKLAAGTHADRLDELLPDRWRDAHPELCAGAAVDQAS